VRVDGVLNLVRWRGEVKKVHPELNAAPRVIHLNCSRKI
jgi:hypothetical protein